MILLIDQGNSRSKSAWWNGKRLQPALPPLAHAGFLEAICAVLSESTVVWLASTAGSAREQLTTVLRAHGATVHIARTERGHGLRLSYAQLSRYGVDRWLALLAAREVSAGKVLVVDAGTALTMDGVDAAGTQRVSVLCPGVALMRQSLAIGTAAVAVPPVARFGLSARDTAESVNNGVWQSLCGAVERVARQFAPELVLITGGDGALLKRRIQIDAAVSYRPNLVIEGLALRSAK